MAEKTRIRNILIIEDEPPVAKLLSMRLRSVGYVVGIAVDGEKGLDAVESMRPDLIILDLYLPKVSGEEVCKKVRESFDDQISRIPIIMVTAKDSVADRIVGKVIGASAYITKPFEFAELVEEIKRIESGID